jgi:hypothetical protein
LPAPDFGSASTWRASTDARVLQNAWRQTMAQHARHAV